MAGCIEEKGSVGMYDHKLFSLKTQQLPRVNVPIGSFSPHEVLRRGSSDGVLWIEDNQLTAAVVAAGDEGDMASPQNPYACSVGTIATDRS